MTTNVPYSFVPGQKAKAEEVNTNFDTLKNAINANSLSTSSNLTAINSNTSSIGTLQTSKANINGNIANTFSVAPATEDDHAVCKSQLDSLSGVPVGLIFWYPAITAPVGYLKCDGSAVSRTTYSALFALIGVTYGSGDNAITFNLPDLRGEFIRGWDDSRGVDSGRVLGSPQNEEVGPHTHPVITKAMLSPGYDWTQTNVWKNTTNGATELNDGLENRPRNVALLACIKY